MTPDKRLACFLCRRGRRPSRSASRYSVECIEIGCVWRALKEPGNLLKLPELHTKRTCIHPIITGRNRYVPCVLIETAASDFGKWNSLPLARSRWSASRSLLGFFLKTDFVSVLDRSCLLLPPTLLQPCLFFGFAKLSLFDFHLTLAMIFPCFRRFNQIDGIVLHSASAPNWCISGWS